MIIRKSEERGHNTISWLDSMHTFSFGQYYDPNWQGFNQLVVINEDFIAPIRGFGSHTHKDMEILTYVISGMLRHEDSMGNLGFIHPGEIQAMSAGTGITHSEHNNKTAERAHILQIWVLPDHAGLKPRYEKANIFHPDEYNFMKVIAAPFDEETSGVSLHAHAKFWLGRFNQSESIIFKPTLFPHFWIQLIKKGLSLNGKIYKEGDGVGFNAAEEVKIDIGDAGAEFLIIEVA
ncbi:MAG: pirin family protein [Bacteriovorax sp.]